MKKKISVLVALMLTLQCLLTACGGSAGDVTMGLGYHTDLASDSHNIGDEVYGQALTETTIQANIHLASIMVSADGKIAKCYIDAISVSAAVDANGALITDTANAAFQTKKELKENYNLKPASGIQKEWFEQVYAFETWCIGKTVDEIKNMDLNEGKPTDAILASGCTIDVSAMAAAVVNAFGNLTATGASSNDSLNIGVIASLSNGNNASADKDGQVDFGINFCATAKNADNKLTCTVIDSLSATPTWDATGKMTFDTQKALTSKYDLKDLYGMKPASSIQKEWFEQITAFCSFAAGKTADEIKAIGMNESGYPTDTILTSGCTMAIAPYVNVVVKSLANN